MLDLGGNGALLSDCGSYRWRLDRHIGAGHIKAAVFGVNPSTADAMQDDATVRKWRGFGSRLEWERFIVGNIFGFRATDVRELSRTPDPFGSENQIHIGRIIEEADILIPCWGSRSKLPKDLRQEMDRFRSTLMTAGKPVMCWGLTSSGDPRHPLMLGYDTPLVRIS